MAVKNISAPLRLRSDWPLINGSDVTLRPDLPTENSTGDRTTVLEARHLRKSYGSHVAVKDITFSIQSGEVLGLLGPNGAGKSTSMFMLAKLLAATSGEVFLKGQEFNGRNLDQRRLFGIVPQEYAIYDELSAIANLMFFGKLYGLRGHVLKSRCDEVIEEIGLVQSAHRPAGQYSGGMKRRLNFGIALMHKPEILILDEPTLGVDPQSRSLLMNCIRRQAADGGCVIFASHHMEEVQSVCQRVVIIDQGRVVANDSIHNLLTGLAADLHLYVDRTTGITNELEGLAQVGIGSSGEQIVIVPGNSRLSDDHLDSAILRNELRDMTGDNSRDVLDFGQRLQATLRKLQELGIRVLSVETQQSNLEQLFLKLTGKRLRD